MQTIIVEHNLEYSEILSKKYKIITFSEEYRNHHNDYPSLVNEQMRLEHDNLYIYAFQDSPFYHYFLQNIPKCKKLAIRSPKGNYPDASLLTKVKKLELLCFRGSARITPEYLTSLKNIPIVKGVVYYPEYKDIDFTNIYCEYPKIDEIPISMKYLIILNSSRGDTMFYLNELYRRLPEFYQLERLTILFVPTPEELELLVKMPIKSFRLDDVFCRKNIDYVIKANLFEKMNTPCCSLSEESLEDNYVLTKFVIHEDSLMDENDEEFAKYVNRTLERNKKFKSDMRFFKTKAILD